MIENKIHNRLPNEPSIETPWSPLVSDHGVSMEGSFYVNEIAPCGRLWFPPSNAIAHI
ncbi:MAG: hypothetical protein NVS9B9_10410 [Ktedonobacteraceae bacterium]